MPLTDWSESFILADDATTCGTSRPTATTVLAPVRGAEGDFFADIILGKPDFSEITPNLVSNNRLFNPGGVIVDRSTTPNRLYVYDGGNSRVLGLSHLGVCQPGPNLGNQCTSDSDCTDSACIIQDGIGADLVIGQPSFTSSACNGDGNFQTYPNSYAFSQHPHPSPDRYRG